MAHRQEIRFLLNDRQVAIGDVGASDTLLDHLRLTAALTGTKEGCAEGDCGACTVLVGRLRDGVLRYQPVNACIRFLASVDACHVVTVEHLRAGEGGGLHPVQQAMVDHHGSQCGFCTPGIVMALYALWMQTPEPTRHQIETALQGNLCRCTGYAPIIRAAEAAARYGTPATDPLNTEREAVTAQLSALQDGHRVEVARDDDRAILPASVDDLAAVLLEHPAATVVAGATDVGLWVTKHFRNISPAVFTGHLEGLQQIEVGDTAMRIGAGASYTDCEAMLAAEYPHLTEYWNRIAGWQVRNMGTVGGNIANGSPIGDTPPVLIALGAEIVLRRGEARRSLAVEDFFIDYGKQDRAPGEFIEQIIIPRRANGTHHAAYKVSKRRDDDISSVAAAFNVTVAKGTVPAARIAFGGMAGIPKRAKAAEAAIVGAAWSEATLLTAAASVDDDFAPLTDWRASSEYRIQVARNLFRRFWLDQGAGDAAARLSA